MACPTTDCTTTADEENGQQAFFPTHLSYLVVRLACDAQRGYGRKQRRRGGDAKIRDTLTARRVHVSRPKAKNAMSFLQVAPHAEKNNGDAEPVLNSPHYLL